jgi:hypothetical protein
MTDTPTPATPAATCPACGAVANGRFCSSCGAALAGVACPECATQLSPGARFCHRCGASVLGGSTKTRAVDSALPWAVAAIALVALTALVAGRNFRGARNAEPPPQSVESPADGVVRGPDISSLSPRDRAESLFDRIMLLSESGKGDSVLFFAPMAIAAFQMLDSLTVDDRYDLGRVGLVSGLSELAHAQADTILQGNPRHLLGLTLAASAARLDRNPAAESALQRRLLAAEKTELATGREEYQRHRTDIDSALAAARERGAR